MEAVRGLRDVSCNLFTTTASYAQLTTYLQTISRGITDAVQEQFATTSLKTLMQDHRLLSQPDSHYWALSSLEILIEGEILGSGAFGTVYVGRWNGTRVAVKQLAMGTPRRVRELHFIVLVLISLLLFRCSSRKLIYGVGYNTPILLPSFGLVSSLAHLFSYQNCTSSAISWNIFLDFLKQAV
jgi:hypothetical protein